MAGKLASLLIKISANGAEAEKELRTLEKKMANTAKSFEKVGKSMSKYVTLPLTALAGVSVNAANTQVQAEAKLLTALKGREDIQKRLIDQAAELQSRSTLGDEAIIEQQAFLAALGLSEKQIGDTIEAAAQLSAALNMDLGSAVKNLAKTYGGMTGELGESIPALKDLTAEQLKAGQAVEYINENYKGFAETAAETGTGPLVQLKNTLGDIAEQFGVIMLPALKKLVEWLKNLAQWFQNLSPGAKKAIVVIGGLAAAFGPCAIAIGKVINAIKLFKLAIPGLKIAMSGMLGPIAAIVAAVTAIATAWISAYNAQRRYINSIKEAGDKMSQIAYSKHFDEYSRPIYSDKDLERKLAEVREKNRGQIEMYERMTRGSNEENAAAYRARAEQLRQEALAIEAVIAMRKREREDAAALAKRNTDLNTQLNDGQEDAVGLLGELQKKISELEKSKLAARTESDIKRINFELTNTKAELEMLMNLGNKTIVSKIEKPEGFDGLAFADSADPWTLTLPNMENAINEMSTYWQDFANKAERSAELIDSVTQVIGSALANLATTIGEGLGNLMSGLDVDPGKALLELLGNSLKALGAAFVTYATTMQAFKESLKDIFRDPFAAIALGISAIALGTMFTNMAKEPIKLANGGLAYGPTLAVVGDNRGAASDPEVIAPLSKLRNYMGGQQMELVGGVTFELRGDVARAIINRDNVRLNRKG